MATKARTVPFEAETVLKNMNRATDHLQDGHRSSPQAGPGTRPQGNKRRQWSRW